MLNPLVAQSVIDHALFLGADFAEIFIEHHHSGRVELLSGDVDKVITGIDFGIGVRLFFARKVFYGYTNRCDEKQLKKIVSLLCARDRCDQATTSRPLSFSRLSNQHPVGSILSDDPCIAEKAAFLHQLDSIIRAQSNKISQTVVSVIQREQRVEIFNSYGVHVSDNRHYTRIAALAVATSSDDEQSTGFEAPGALAGWELHQDIDSTALGERVAHQALVKLGAQSCPSGAMPVVIDNGFGGVIFHEACGHLLETTSVEKKASVFHDQMGKVIASPVVSAVDDGTLPHAWGSSNIDDEGMETQRTQLIREGKLISFMVDHIGSIKTGYTRTGSGRRESYKFAPASRMRNTFIEPGNDSLDDMISSIESGIYAKKMGGGSVQPGTGEFNFVVQEPYLIKGGKVTAPLKSATLIGTGSKVLKEISMVGKDLVLAAGMCGSVSGSIPTTVGQPALKVDSLLVGGGRSST